MDIASQFKKGYKTTEFWVGAIPSAVAGIAVIAKLFGVDVDETALTAALVGFIPGTGYVLGRSWLKKSRVEAMAKNGQGQ